MPIPNWFREHGFFAMFLAAATGYFLFVPLSGYLYVDFEPVNFIVMHSIIEAMSVIVSFMCFAIAFHSHKLAKNNQNLFLGVTFLTIGIIDVAHALSYKGMPDFVTLNTVNKATQLWIAARFIGALAFLAAAFVGQDADKRVFRPYPLAVLGVTLSFAVVTWVLYSPDSFPAMFVEGAGLTPLKVDTEYLIVCIEAAALVLFYRLYLKTGQGHLIYFMGALVMGIFSELLFTFYASPFDIYNLMGHVYKMAGYMFVYLMLFVTSIERPYAELSNAKDVLREYAHHLEDMVSERTMALEERNTELVRLSKLKNDFLAMCSHDMKNPLQTNTLIIELLLDEMDGPLTDKQRDSIKIIMENELEQHRLITNLLDLVRRGEGGMVLNTGLVDVKKMVAGLVRWMEVVAGDSNIGFKLSIDGEEPMTAVLDEFKIGQAMNNLASNALKFTPEGGDIRLDVSVGDELRVRMFNSGDAIPAERLADIFEKYTRLSATGRARHEGVGLGLNIAKGNVELHGGRIWAESEEGVGNTFCFTVPLKAGPAVVSYRAAHYHASA